MVPATATTTLMLGLASMPSSRHTCAAVHMLAGGGFGKSPGKRDAAVLDEEAAQCLQQAGGDLNVAQSIHFQQSLLRLRQEDPALFAAMQAAEQAAQGSSPKALPGSCLALELSWPTPSVPPHAIIPVAPSPPPTPAR